MTFPLLSHNFPILWFQTTNQSWTHRWPRWIHRAATDSASIRWTFHRRWAQRFVKWRPPTAVLTHVGYAFSRWWWCWYWVKMIFEDYILVGGLNHLEKYESQWEGWHPIYYGNIIQMIQTTNQYHIVTQYWNIHHIVTSFSQWFTHQPLIFFHISTETKTYG